MWSYLGIQHNCLIFFISLTIVHVDLLELLAAKVAQDQEMKDWCDSVREETLSLIPQAASQWVPSYYDLLFLSVIVYKHVLDKDLLRNFIIGVMPFGE